MPARSINKNVALAGIFQDRLTRLFIIAENNSNENHSYM